MSAIPSFCGCCWRPFEGVRKGWTLEHKLDGAELLRCPDCSAAEYERKLAESRRVAVPAKPQRSGVLRVKP